MNFILNGYDYTDVDAFSRRQAAREEHLDGIKRMKEAGLVLYAAAMIDDKEQMCGSTLILEMASREAVDDYLKNEAYVTGKVWEKIQVIPCKVPPLFR